jgi:AraC-like DNA-binding protein
VARVWRALVASSGRRRIADLAAETGWSRKRAAMLVRLTPAIEAIVAGTAIADVAARCGYADQSHLTRDLREPAGYTPAALYRDRHEVGHDEVMIPPGSRDTRRASAGLSRRAAATR